MKTTMGETENSRDHMLLVKKPAGWTSFDVVAKLRNVLHIRKIGHAGTLDPMATGLLLLCTGKKTKDIEQFIGLEKEYRASMRLGGVTASYDAETPVTDVKSTDGLTEEMIRTTLLGFVGTLKQVPPMHSAVKVRGRRLYKDARKGREVERPEREVQIRAIEQVQISIPDVSFVVVCSKGTYIRALVNDIGQALGCGAYLTALERTRIGEFSLSNAMTIDEVREAFSGSDIPIV